VYNIRTVAVYGGGGKWEMSKALKEECPEIVIATPGRFIEMVCVANYCTCYTACVCWFYCLFQCNTRRNIWLYLSFTPSSTVCQNTLYLYILDTMMLVPRIYVFDMLIYSNIFL